MLPGSPPLIRILHMNQGHAPRILGGRRYEDGVFDTEPNKSESEVESIEGDGGVDPWYSVRRVDADCDEECWECQNAKLKLVGSLVSQL
jgi:hypothetical protein